MLAGFGNIHQTEALDGALPTQQNTPQHTPFGLYAEQLSGSAFTCSRATNLHSWLYRILPSVVHADYQPYKSSFTWDIAPLQAPNPFRWRPHAALNKPTDFIDGWFYLGGNSSVKTFIYQCNVSMNERYFSNHDGELLFVPYAGEAVLFTEFGKLPLKPGHIAVIPRGVKFKVLLESDTLAGYLCENSGAPLSLPQLGVIGANGLANPRHFLYPHAAFETEKKSVMLICKYQHHFWQSLSVGSPLNVVAWQGNYAPYSYDLSLFNTINTVSFDHPDPSIFTVLTSESHTPGVANLDFVIFPPRWLIAEHTFRPPYFHRNIMNELMGLVSGEYDAKQDGFLPGGVSIHNCMTAHGPDTATYHKAIQSKLKPSRYRNTLAFMFETKEPWIISEAAMQHATRDKTYTDCWQSLAAAFHT